MSSNDFILYKKAVRFYKSKQYSNAISIFERLYSLYPDDLYNKFYYGSSLLRINSNTALGVKILKELRNTSFNDSSLLELADYFMKKNNFNQAEKYLNILIQDDTNKYAIILYAKLKIKLKDYDTAKKFLLKGISLDDESRMFSLSELANIEKELGNYDKAEYYLSLLLNTDGKSFALCELGRLAGELGDFEKAKDCFELILDYGDTYLAKYELAKLYYEYNSFELAEFYFNEVLNVDNYIAYSSYIYLGKIEKYRRNYDKAEYYFNLALSSNSRCKNIAYLELIYLYIKQEKYMEAYGLVDSLISINNVSVDKVSYNNIRNVVFYLKYKLNLLSKEEMENTTYYFRKQLVNYDEFRTIDHISEHLDEIEEKRTHTLFYSNIDTMNLYYVCSELIKKMDPINSTFADIYVVTFDNPLGTIYNNPTNTIQIVTLANSKDIITIYPIVNKQIKRGNVLCR